MTPAWGEMPVTGAKHLPPDPDFMRSLGHNYSLEAAIADIIDNSLDAQATHVLVRFVRDGERLLGLLIIDNGRGMGATTLDRAMTLGSRRRYTSTDMGHFGVGLKAASLGQAKSLTVLSQSSKEAVGRRWTIEKAEKGFECEVIDSAFVADYMSRDWGIPLYNTGTIIRWDRVKSFPIANRQEVVDRYLEDVILSVRRHLGLVFHRLLARNDIAIRIDVEDLTLNDTGAMYEVTPIDPFGYQRSGRVKYPKILSGKLEGKVLTLNCHIWPGRSHLPAFKLPGGSPETFQGFFFYRRDRLLQAGGWNGIVNYSRDLQLARVAIDIDQFDPASFSMNPEKTRVETSAQFLMAIENAIAPDRSTFTEFLQDSIKGFKESRTHDHSRSRVIAPGKGFVPSVKVSIAYELGFLPGEDPIDIRWESCVGNHFFELDRENRLIRLNKKYRHALIGSSEGSLNDAPLVKALLYLLVEELFHGAFLKSKSKDTIEYLQAILTSAAEAELK